MTIRWFWLYSDGKTVKEISWQQWQKIVQKDYQSEEHSRLLCRMYEYREKTEVYLHKGRTGIWVPLSQLEAVFGMMKS